MPCYETPSKSVDQFALCLPLHHIFLIHCNSDFLMYGKQHCNVAQTELSLSLLTLRDTQQIAVYYVLASVSLSRIPSREMLVPLHDVLQRGIFQNTHLQQYLTSCTFGLS
jgi:hypothetical protein